jgi:hypothetical protein
VLPNTLKRRPSGRLFKLMDGGFYLQFYCVRAIGLKRSSNLICVHNSLLTIPNNTLGRVLLTIAFAPPFFI